MERFSLLPVLPTPSDDSLQLSDRGWSPEDAYAHKQGSKVLIILQADSLGKKLCRPACSFSTGNALKSLGHFTGYSKNCQDTKSWKEFIRIWNFILLSSFKLHFHLNF